MRAALVLTITAALAGCNQPPSAPLPGETAAPATAAAVSPAPTTPVSPVPTPGVVSAPLMPPSASRDPQAVLVAWAKAVSLREWASARGYWGDSGVRSGLTQAQFAAQWGTLKDPQLDIAKGDQEGAAGSIFYTAPVTIRDGARTIRGEVVLRRVNDVPGATAEQLRWHIESTTLKI